VILLVNHPAGAAHYENQDSEVTLANRNGESHAQLRPFQLLLARQGVQ